MPFPREHPHNLVYPQPPHPQPIYAPFIDHLAYKRRMTHPNASTPLHQVRHASVAGADAVQQRPSGRGYAAYRQAVYSMPLPRPKPLAQHLEAAAPEHMLRRKTPNGTLKDGYDGTPIEWTSSGPPPQKHLLRHPSNEQELDFLSRRRAAFPFSGPVLSLNQNPPFDASMGYRPLDGPANAPLYGLPSFTQHQHRVHTHAYAHDPTLDSMLHQNVLPIAPTQRWHSHPYSYPSVPVAMQPIWPPTIEPTASGPHIPYGPYWPNGAYEPYRPAALREGRFYSQFARINLNEQAEPSLDSTPPYRSPAVSPFVQPPAYPNGDFPITYRNSHLSGHAPFHPLPTNANAGRLGGEHTQLFIPRVDDGVGMPNISNPPRAFPPPSGLPSEDFAHAYPQRAHSLAAASVSGGAAQFRDKALAWAHRAHENLIVSIHQARKLQGMLDRQQQQQMRNGMVDGHRLHNHSQSQSQSYSNPQASSSPPTMLAARDQPAPFSPAVLEAQRALSLLRQLTSQSATLSPSSSPLISQTDATLLGGCLAYGLGDLRDAVDWFTAVLAIDANNVEALSNIAAAHMALGNRAEAERLWTRAIRLRPGYFEAVEHLVGLLCVDQRPGAAVEVIAYVEGALRDGGEGMLLGNGNGNGNGSGHGSGNGYAMGGVRSLGYGLSGYSSSPVENGRLVALIHAKGNMQYAAGKIAAAASAFEEAIMISVGRAVDGIPGLIKRILAAFALEIASHNNRDDDDDDDNDRNNGEYGTHDVNGIGIGRGGSGRSSEAILLLPKTALRTAQLVFPQQKTLPGLLEVTEGQPRRAAVAVTSNCLLSLAKIYQDGVSAGSGPPLSEHHSTRPQPPSVQDILALYYLSLSLQPSPSTANNVGILLASVQPQAQAATDPAPGRSRKITATATPARCPPHLHDPATPFVPGIQPGTGPSLALSYYNFGLSLDSQHAHLYTNLGSLLKDLGQLDHSIRMYERAVDCDPRFDIALANLANAVKDKGRVAEAIAYYRRAVEANDPTAGKGDGVPRDGERASMGSGGFAEADCGLANALNSVCDWRGRGGVFLDAGEGGVPDRWHVDEEGMLVDARDAGARKVNGLGNGYGNGEGRSSAEGTTGWIGKVVSIVRRQLREGQSWGRGTIKGADLRKLLSTVLRDDETKIAEWMERMQSWSGQDWEGARVTRYVERATKQIGWQWYQDLHVKGVKRPASHYERPQLPASLTVPTAPTVLPFHTFTCPLTAPQIRQISQRNGLRISASTLRAPWLPSTVFKPPPPPSPHLNVGYVSSDFNNHPLAHLMQSVFGLHDASAVRAFCYATTPSDKSTHRVKIEAEAPVFYDASAWSLDRLVNQIVADEIHILVNLNGYTRGARNEVFAARPAPIQMSFMGFAGTLGAEWCDYLLADESAVPRDTLRPWRGNVGLEDLERDGTFPEPRSRNASSNAKASSSTVTTTTRSRAGSRSSMAEGDDAWVYAENIIFTRHTFFCCDHRQSAPDSTAPQLGWRAELARRQAMRAELFPSLPRSAVILGNFNQLYKIEPGTFRTWLRILQAVPAAVLWLLRFPDLGEANLLRTAAAWASPDVTRRILFTDVAPKSEHIARAAVCDLFLDTPECNAHTTSADVLWSGTPLLTYPRYPYKMCSRMASSILRGAMPDDERGRRAADELVCQSDEAYEARAVELAAGLASVKRAEATERAEGGEQSEGADADQGEEACRLLELRRLIYEGRWTSPLFDTRRWVADLEEAYAIAWDRWVAGDGGDIWL